MMWTYEPIFHGKSDFGVKTGPKPSQKLILTIFHKFPNFRKMLKIAGRRHLTLPYLTLPYLTLPYLTLPYLTLPYFTLPYLTLPHPTLP